MRVIKLFLLAGITAALIWLFNSPKPFLPLAMGKFMSPFSGFWKNGESEKPNFSESVNIPGLKAPVKVYYDKRMVPHVMAKNNADLYRAQGYVMARDRLFQMDLTAKAAAGRLSEWIDNEKVLANDRLMRRMGMTWSAQKSLEYMTRDPDIKIVLDNFRDGINAWIEGLSPKDYPIEYKLMDVAPEQWDNLKTNLVLKIMAQRLTSYSHDFPYTNACRKLGQEAFSELYKLFPDSLDPIIPAGTEWAFEPVKIDTPAGIDTLFPVPEMDMPNTSPNAGSNNWAVSPTRSKSGNAILCNDPHLGLSFPSTWYEMQLSGPDANTYGVCLPGTPLIIIGFNNNVSWGVTNASRDVFDWYTIEFQDGKREAYRYDGKWEKVEQRLETIKIRGKADLVDTVLYTHHGPVVYDRNFSKDPETPINLALRWSAHNPGNEPKTFYLLNRAKNHADYRKALPYFACPGQNFVFASKDGDVAITQQGNFPAKWPGQGRLVLNGANPKHEWQAWIPAEQNPHILNPARGFVSSANQLAADSTYPYYQAGNYEKYRNRYLNKVLGDTNRKFGIEDMQRLQNDNFNLRAKEMLPMLISLLEETRLNPQEREVLGKLKNWDYRNEADKKAPVYFTAWDRALQNRVWGDEFNQMEGKKKFPSKFYLGATLTDTLKAIYVDDHTTQQEENASQLVTMVFKEVMDTLIANHPDMVWTEYNEVFIKHLLLTLKPFNRRNIKTGGSGDCLNANRTGWGPSWRMIVEMGPKVKAYGIYPGGQSGSPGSPYYDNQVEDWAQGKYYELHLLDPARPDKEVITFTQTLSPGND